MITLLATYIACILFIQSASGAMAPLYRADPSNVVPNQYMVVLHKNISISERDKHVVLLEQRLSRKEEIKRVFTIGDLKGFTAILSRRNVLMELRNREVLYIEEDQVVSVGADPIQTEINAVWGLDRIDQRILPLDIEYDYYTSAGNGIYVYVIDTGILLTHNEFVTGRAIFGQNFVAGEISTDCNGHGTHVAGIIGGSTYGVAKLATLVSVKVLGCGGSGTWSDVVSGIEWTVRQHTYRGPTARSVANLSLGGGASTTIDNAIINAFNANITIAVAAGNNGEDACNTSPARVAQVMTVAACNATDVRASFSNYGKCVDTFAPGVGIQSSWIGASGTEVRTLSGTSMASPHVAGVMALRMAHLIAEGNNVRPSPTENNDWFITAATKDVIVDPKGSPNRLAYTLA